MKILANLKHSNGGERQIEFGNSILLSVPEVIKVSSNFFILVTKKEITTNPEYNFLSLYKEATCFFVPTYSANKEFPTGARTLTEKELKVVSLVAEGLSNNAVAEKVGTTQQVVKNKLRIIFDKVGMDNRTELAVWWATHKSEYPTQDILS